MNKKKCATIISQTFAFLILSSCLSSCLKTTQEIQREQAVDDLMGENRQSKSVVSDLLVQIKNIQEELNKQAGQIDELKQQGIGKKNQELLTLSAQQVNHTEKILALEATLSEQTKQIETLQNQLKSHDAYISETSKAFKSISTSNSKSDLKKSKTVSEVEDGNKIPAEAEKLFEKKKYSATIKLCKSALERDDLTDGKKNRCRFLMGSSEKELKNYDEALLNFGQIYTDWPKSQLAPQALLEMAHVLKEKKQTKQASQMLEKIKKEYPKTKAAKEASKLLED